jgi:two-component system sensor histidine kinase BaeS
MVRRDWRRAAPPPWWPENEPWPGGRPPHWQRGRARFVRRIGCLFALVLMLSAAGGTWLLSLVGARVGPIWITQSAPIQLGLAALTAVVLLAIFAFTMRRVGAPMSDIITAADRVAAGDLNAYVNEHGPPPIRSVARAFNSMTEALKSNDERRRHLMADIAHELRTPLAVIQGRLEGLLDGVYPRTDERLTELLSDARQLARLVDDLQTLATADSGALQLRKEPTDLALVIHDAARLCSPIADTSGVTIKIDAAELPLLDSDPLRIREVLVNLISNAVRHSAAGGVVTISAAVENERVAVSVADTGRGMSPDEKSRIFDRFYKGAGSTGSGLGLTIARGLMKAHGGDIAVRSSPGAGTTMTVHLPLSHGL